MIYSVDDFPHEHPNGLGVTINYVLWQMLRARPHSAWVNITKPNNPYREAARGPNVWDYYFEQPHPIEGLDDVQPLPIEHPLDLPFSGHRDWTLLIQRAVQPFASTNMIVRPHIRAEIDSFMGQYFKGRVLGVSVRGTDKISEYQPAKDAELLGAIAALRERLRCDTVFLMTDDARYHALISQAFGAISITMPRSKVSLHHNPPRGPYESGRWAIIDGMLGAACDWFAYTPSNFATIPLIFGGHEEIIRLPSRCEILPFSPRIFKALEL